MTTVKLTITEVGDQELRQVLIRHNEVVNERVDTPTEGAALVQVSDDDDLFVVTTTELTPTEAEEILYVLTIPSLTREHHQDALGPRRFPGDVGDGWA